MYFAFRWLVSLTLSMWMIVCGIDVCLRNYKNNIRREIDRSLDSSVLNYENVTTQLLQEAVTYKSKYEYHKTTRRNGTTSVFHYAMFLAGAFAVSVFNKKSQIINLTKTTLTKIDIYGIAIFIRNFTKNIILHTNLFEKLNSAVIWRNIHRLVNKIKLVKQDASCSILENNHSLNILLLKKLKDFEKEHKKLGNLLIAANQENKNIKKRYQLESMAKNRLVQHMEAAQKNIKENKSRYVTFQNLYLVTQEENIFLKGRLHKLMAERDNTERDLMAVLNKVYLSKNSELKAYCSRFIVKPSNSLLKADVISEIEKYLQKSRFTETSTIKAQVEVQCNEEFRDAENNPNRSLVLEHACDKTLVPLISNAPFMTKGLSEECIWTVKDKDGIIEKLYEYNYESGFNSGDKVRKIREYSVYYDKDCLLDFSRSRALMSTTDINQRPMHGICSAKDRFLTGSPAFYQFMQKNKIMPSSSSFLRSSAFSLQDD